MSAATPGQQATLDEAFERAESAAESDDSPAAVQEDREDAACHHDAVWTESGVCMACDGTVGAAATVAERRQLGADAGGGRL